MASAVVSRRWRGHPRYTDASTLQQLHTLSSPLHSRGVEVKLILGRFMKSTILRTGFIHEILISTNLKIDAPESAFSLDLDVVE